MIIYQSFHFLGELPEIDGADEETLNKHKRTDGAFGK